MFPSYKVKYALFRYAVPLFLDPRMHRKYILDLLCSVTLHWDFPEKNCEDFVDNIDFYPPGIPVIVTPPGNFP